MDLILGQGSFASGWHAHMLTQPGAFLISAPEFTVPERARGYLITDAQVTRQAARYAGRWRPRRPDRQDRPTRPSRPPPVVTGTRQAPGALRTR